MQQSTSKKMFFVGNTKKRFNLFKSETVFFDRQAGSAGLSLPKTFLARYVNCVHYICIL